MGKTITDTVAKTTVGEEFVKKYIMIIRESAGAERHLLIIPKPGMSMSEISKYTTATAPKGGYMEIDMFSKKFVALHVKKRFVDMIRGYDDYRRIYFHLSVWFTRESLRAWFPQIVAEVRKVLEKKRQATLESNVNRVKKADAKEIASVTKNKSVKSCVTEQRSLERDSSKIEEVINAPKHAPESV